jgi:hypothetical protein
MVPSTGRSDAESEKANRSIHGPSKPQAQHTTHTQHKRTRKTNNKTDLTHTKHPKHHTHTHTHTHTQKPQTQRHTIQLPDTKRLTPKYLESHSHIDGTIHTRHSKSVSHWRRTQETEHTESNRLVHGAETQFGNACSRLTLVVHQKELHDKRTT